MVMVQKIETEKKIWIVGRRVLTVLILIALITGGHILINFARKAEPVSGDRTAWLTTTWIAHRGVHNDQIPENTVAAFNAAIEKGRPIELDVSMTRDKQLVVFHDKKLKRLFGLDAYVKDMTYEQLAGLEFPDSTERIPLFGQILTVVDGRVPLLIEIKNEGEVGEMEQRVYEELKAYQGPYAIQSFNPYSLKWFREHAPHVLRGQLSGSFIVSDYEVEYAGTTRLPWYKRIPLSHLLLNFESRPHFIAYEVEYADEKTFQELKKLGVPVLGWTIKDQAMYQKAKDQCDNLIVDPF